jgi:hypothetical protein
MSNQVKKLPVKVKRNLNDMINELDGVDVSVGDIEQLALQVIMESDKSYDKINAIKILVDIKKHLSQVNNEKDLLEILRGENNDG